MLPELTKFEDTITLVKETGIQFVDFGLKLDVDDHDDGYFYKVTDRSVTRLAKGQQSGVYYFDKTAEPNIADIVSTPPSYKVPLEESLSVFSGQWLPVPFLRFTPPYTYDQGPANWARLYINKLDTPDRDGNNYRVTLAFDTRLMSYNPHVKYLAPSPDDVQAGVEFKLSICAQQTSWFFAQEWVTNWLDAVLKEALLAQSGEDQIDAKGLEKGLAHFRSQAHLLNILSLITPTTLHTSETKPTLEGKLPKVRLISADYNTDKVIPVDLVLDVGNSRTCGILLEGLNEGGGRLSKNYVLQLRDLSQPEYVYSEPFDSRVEFTQAAFGDDFYAGKSGRRNAFQWPTIVRVGSEAARLAGRRLATKGRTGLSSPKRYLWDKSEYPLNWRFNSNKDTEVFAFAEPFCNHIDDAGVPLYRPTKPGEPPRESVFDNKYSRSSLMAFMLAEVLMQALNQINSIAQRTRQGHTDIPRQLNSVILTVPPGMPQVERAILNERLEDAIAIVWKSLEWHAGDETPHDAVDHPTPDNPLPKVPLPTTSVEWDEASCGQLVYLFTEVSQHFSGHPEQFFQAIARPDKKLSADQQKITLATIDIGGGTTDLVVNEYQLNTQHSSGSNVEIVPKQLFRESFKVAGDDIVLDVIKEFVLPSLEQAFSDYNVPDIETVKSHLYGVSNSNAQDEIYRQQLTLQVFLPIALNILKHYEDFDIAETHSEQSYTFGELMPAPATQPVLDFVSREVQSSSRSLKKFDLHAVKIKFNLLHLHGLFVSNKFPFNKGKNLKMSINSALAGLCEVIDKYACDMVLLTGRPSRLPGVQALIRSYLPLNSGRVLPMHNYHTGSWYPFNKNNLIEDPKTTAAVGAMLCMQAKNGSLANFSFNELMLKPYSTMRYFGVIGADRCITHDSVLYADIDTRPENGKIKLPTTTDLNSDNPDQQKPITLTFKNSLLILGFRQFPLERWPATPLYRLGFTKAGNDKYNEAKLRTRDGNIALHVSFKIESDDSEQSIIEKKGKYHAVPSDQLVIDRVQGTVSGFDADDLELQLNTLLDTDMNVTSYWLDSGNVKR